MKFRDKETGEVFKIRSAVRKKCAERDCENCRMLKITPEYESCEDWAEEYPQEAAEALGY